MLCACGCGAEIHPKARGEAGRRTRFIHGHHKGSLGKRWGTKRIAPGGQPCDCGCGRWIPEYFPAGDIRYSRNENGHFFVDGGCYKRLNPPSKAARRMRSQYWYIYRPEHPKALSAGTSWDGYVAEHIVIWEEANGRQLLRNEVVHHINGDKEDNRSENLIALTKAEHRSLHEKLNPTPKDARSAAGKKGAAARWQQKHEAEKPEPESR